MKNRADAGNQTLKKRTEPASIHIILCCLLKLGIVYGGNNLNLYDKLIFLISFHKFTNTLIIVSNKVHPTKACPSSNKEFSAIVPFGTVCNPCSSLGVTESCFWREPRNTNIFKYFNWNVLHKEFSDYKLILSMGK